MIHVQILIIRWFLEKKPHIIADSAFGSQNAITLINNWNASATFAVNKDNNAWLWSVLSESVTPDKWRAATSVDKWVASSHTLVASNGKIITQQILSNAYTFTKINFESEIEDETESTETDVINELPSGILNFLILLNL